MSHRVLYLSDQHTNAIKEKLQFLHKYQPKHTHFGFHVRQVPHVEFEPGTLVHINQSPLTMAKDATNDDLLVALSKPPYNIHDVFLAKFDRVFVTYYDVSKNDRFVHQLK